MSAQTSHQRENLQIRQRKERAEWENPPSQSQEDK
jgi:hypothetical protein